MVTSPEAKRAEDWAAGMGLGWEGDDKSSQDWSGTVDVPLQAKQLYIWSEYSKKKKKKKLKIISHLWIHLYEKFYKDL